MFGSSATQDIDDQTIKKITLRTVPLLGLGFMMSILDRSNVSFAALSMNRDLGFTATTFGWGAGIMFVGYLLCEIPSNVFLNRFGARKWIARIMLSWGVVSGLTALVSNAESYYVLRFLLGVAEAGFLPGVMLYLKLWFPDKYRVKILAAFLLFIPLTAVLSAPISINLMKLDGVFGLRGWQSLFLIEAIPSIVLGVLIWRFLPDQVADAAWLTNAEREGLSHVLAFEGNRDSGHQLHDFGSVFGDTRVWALGLINLAIVMCAYALLFWLPQIVHEFGWSASGIAWAVATSNLCGVVAMAIWGRFCKQSGQSVWNVLLPAFVAVVGLLAGAQLLDSPLAAVIAFSIASAGLYASLPAFWAIPPTILSGAAAVSGLALVNTIGSLSGVIGPPVIGYVKDRTQSFRLGIEIMDGVLIAALLLLLLIRSRLWPKDSLPGSEVKSSLL